MTQALYGRMKIGRCAPRDLGHIGCHADALSFLDSKCSNKRDCNLEIPQDFGAEKDLAGACADGLLSYLEADFMLSQRYPYVVM